MAEFTQKLYKGRHVSLLTQHGKELLIRELLQSALGCQLVHTNAFDTDQLGTFTKDINRMGSQLDAARKKALLGMELTQSTIGLASEGSFGADPFAGFMPWNSEIVLWVDQQLGIEVVGFAQGAAQSTQKQVKSLSELMLFANEAQFPSHHLVFRPDDEHHPLIIKGINDPGTLEHAFNRCLKESQSGTVYVENDLRAFSNPTRQKMIVRATEDLVQKLLSHCPQCASPGYWLQKRNLGLPCGECGTATRQPISEIWKCLKCDYHEEKHLAGEKLADPARCDVCNP